MLRTCATLSVFGLLALAFAMALNSGGRTVSSLLPGTAAFEPMINSGTGQPLTLESVHKDVVWHRKTARDPRELDGVAGRDRKSVVSGKSVSGRLDLEWCRIIKKKKK